MQHDLTITESSFGFQRNEPKINTEKLLDGLYVVRTSVETMNSERVVEFVTRRASFPLHEDSGPATAPHLSP